MSKTKAWLWIGGAFIVGAGLGALTGLPLSFVGLQSKIPLGGSLTTTPATGN
jgi:hypothetical protein